MARAEPSRVRPRRVRRALLGVAVFVAISVAGLFAAAGWLLATESGLRALVSASERFAGETVSVTGARGRVLGALEVERVDVTLPTVRVSIEALSLDWTPSALLSGRVDIAHLRVGAIDYSAAPSDDEAPTALEPPARLTLPVGIRAREISLARLSVLPWHETTETTPGRETPPDEREPSFEIHDLAAALVSDGRTHHVEHLSLDLPFAALALEAQLEAGEQPPRLALDGTVQGQQGEHAFDFDYRARGDLERLELQLEGTGAGVRAEANVVASPFAAAPVRAVQLVAREIDPSRFAAGAPFAELEARVELTAPDDGEWRLAGPVQVVNVEPGSLDRNALPLVSVDAQLDWSPEVTRVEAFDLQLVGDGHVHGEAEWRPPENGEGLGQVAALFELAGIRTEQLDARLPPTAIAGHLEAQGDTARQEAEFDLQVGEARVLLTGDFVPAQAEEAARFSAQGAITRFDPATLLAQVPPGDINLDFEAAGTLADIPHIMAEWALAPSRFDGQPLGGQGRVAVTGERLADVDVQLSLARNTLRAVGAWGQTGDELVLELDAPALNAVGFGLSGSAFVDARVTGTAQEPGVTLAMTADEITLPGGVGIGSLSADGRLERGLEGPLALTVDVATLGATPDTTWLERAALNIEGTLTQHVIRLTAATPEEDTVELRLSGGLPARAHADAAIDPRWQGEVTTLEATGRMPLHLVRSAPLRLAADHVSLSEMRLDAGENGFIELAHTVWTPERIVARGQLAGLEVVTRGGRRGRGPQGLVLGANWDVDLADRANGELHVFREAGDVWIPGEVPMRLELDHLEVQADIVNNRVAARLDAHGPDLGRIEGAVEALLERQGQAGWGLAPQGALAGDVHLDMPSIAWLAGLLDDEVVLEGALRADIALAGTPSNPDASGRIEGREVAVMLAEYGVELAGGTVVAHFDRDRAVLEQFEFVSPNRIRPRDSRVPVDRFTETPGTLIAHGEVALDSGEGAFEFEADRMPVLQRRDRWLLLSGEGRATSTWTSLDLEASLRADAGYVELADTPPPSLSEDVVIVSHEEERENGSEGGMAVNADVRVSLGDELYLSALGLETRLSGGLRLLMRPDEGLRATGSISTVGGVFRGYGQNLTIERGLINFQGALDNPGLNVMALRKGLAVEAGIEVSGSARRPVIRLVSQPDVPDPEKLSWIVLGRAPSAGGGADMGLLLPAAQALLGGTGGGITDQLSQSLGLDEFGIGQGELGSVSRTQTSQVVGGGSTVSDEGTVSGQVLTLGRRLSSNLFLSFEQSLGGAESLVRLSYQLTRRVSLVARGGTDNSGDVYYTVSFR